MLRLSDFVQAVKVGKVARALALTGPRAVGNGLLGDGQRGSDPVCEAEVEAHPLRDFAGHLSRREIDEKKGLAPFDLAGIRMLSLHA